MPFDTERFITEIQNRPCIWNINIEEYSNRVIKQSAWNEIAKILYNDWQNLEEDNKTKRVQDLQKKWKGLRDYHTREKNKDSSLRSGSGAPKKRKAPFLNMLEFLSVIKKKDPTFSSSTDVYQIPTNMTSNTPPLSSYTYQDDLLHAGTVPEESQSSAKLRKTNVFQEALLSCRMEKRREDDPDMSFLLNILPEMKSMTPTQNFDFRFEVMKIIKKMKYNKNYVYIPEQPGCSHPYQLPCSYTSGTRLSGVQNSPSNSNNSIITGIHDLQNSSSPNSEASSVEDKKPILQDCPDDNDTD